MSELRIRYERLQQDYDRTMNDAIAKNDVSKLKELKKLNEEMSKVLSELLTQSAKHNTGDEEELVKRLQQIQKDYNGLITATDDLETLRRIRAYEEDTSKKSLTGYLIAMIVVALLVIGAMFVFQRALSTPTIASSPPTTSTFV
jgi:hypothetical protein